MTKSRGDDAGGEIEGAGVNFPAVQILRACVKRCRALQPTCHIYRSG
jgi:hypothetical protein